jgi:hypothetical protein
MKMKTIVFSILFFASFGTLFSQGNLQFNQVKLVGAQETVPAGKVWKIESVLNNATLQINTSTTAEQNKATQILINGNGILMATTWGNSYATSSVVSTQLPIWLPEGTNLAASTNVFRVSVIEFNVMP